MHLWRMVAVCGLPHTSHTNFNGIVAMMLENRFALTSDSYMLFNSSHAFSFIVAQCMNGHIVTKCVSV